MTASDKNIQCVHCGDKFVFSAGEQEFFARNGLTTEPKRCKKCRDERRAFFNGSQTVQMHDIICDQCGRNAQVNFKPRGTHPVLCNDCYHEQRR